jgi:hypothetical protein
MNHLAKILYVFALWSFLLISCKTPKKPSEKESAKRDVVIDTSAILTLIEPRTISRDNSMKMITKLLGLAEIKNEAYSFEIRMWFNDPSDTGKIVIVKKQKEEWVSAAYDYRGKTDSLGNVIAIEKRIEENRPASGWTFFLKELNELGLNKLKNYTEIPAYNTCIREKDLVIEIWDNRRYKMYDYPCLERSDEKPGDVRRAERICLFIQKEFSYKLF